MTVKNFDPFKGEAFLGAVLVPGLIDGAKTIASGETVVRFRRFNGGAGARWISASERLTATTMQKLKTVLNETPN